MGSFSDAGRFGEVIALAVKGLAAAEALRAAGGSNLAGKPLIDATNPIAEAPPQNGVLQYFSSLDESLMERLQREFPDARFVKAFNSVGNSRMVNPQFAGGKPTMFICGNDNSAKKTVETILDQFGWETADMGKAEAARVSRKNPNSFTAYDYVTKGWYAYNKFTREDNAAGSNATAQQR